MATDCPVVAFNHLPLLNSQALSHPTGDGVKLISPADGIAGAEGIFKKMYFSKEHPPALLFVRYVMGLGIYLVQNYAKLPLIPAEAGARLDSHILEVVVYSSRKNNVKATNNFGYLLKDLIRFLRGMCHRFALFSRFPLLLLTAPPRCFLA